MAAVKVSREIFVLTSCMPGILRGEFYLADLRRLNAVNPAVGV
jgi:hypothetical protein